MDTKKRPVLIAVIVLLLSAGNFSRLSGTECIRPIHLITLLTMGAAIGISIHLLVKRYREKH